MQIYNPQKNSELEEGLVVLLNKYRKKRDFNASEYILEKSKLLNTYLIKHKLNSCVVGVSGGIDSAVVLSLVSFASKLKGSPIKKIYAVLLPVYSDAATNQKEALRRGVEVAKSTRSKLCIVDLTSNYKDIKKNIETSLGISGHRWSAGQLVAYIKTPVLYYITSLLTEVKFPTIIIGTTNRDEGAYIGYFGKASDGMVDLQLISDIHKSEVYQLANLLKVPKSVIDAVPSGDMYDGRVDEEVFGTNYDFVELYMYYLSLSFTKQNTVINRLDKKAKKQFFILAKRLDNMHKYNLHKYLGDPSVHLDIYKRSLLKTKI